MSATVTRLAPGLLALLGLALAAQALAAGVPGVHPLVLAVLAGAVIGNTVGVPQRLEPGLDQHGLLLNVGIVLLGASISLDALTTAGPRVVGLVLATVSFGLVAVTLAARAVGIRERVGALLAAGASVCGVSAVVAAAGAIDAEESDIAYAAATVLLFDALTLAAFPVLGGLLGLSPRQFGVWAGLTMFSTGPVTAAGFAYAPIAGQWATLTKLVRNTLIGGVALAYSLVYARPDDGIKVGHLWTEFPKFLFGFLGVAVAANSGLLTADSLALLAEVTDWLFLLAFAGLGFEIRLERMRRTGLAPIAVVLGYLLVVSVLALAAVRALGL